MQQTKCEHDLKQVKRYKSSQIPLDGNFNPMGVVKIWQTELVCRKCGKTKYKSEPRA